MFDVSHLRDRPRVTTPTPRELEIAHLVTQGYEDKRIAHLLSISEETVASHLRRLYERLQLGNRVQLAVWYVRHHEGHRCDYQYCLD